MPKKETILVLSAHSDDFVIGAGGTIKKYADEGKDVIAVVFSYGEKSHPWLKEDIVQKMRSKETFEAAKLLKCRAFFYDLKEFKFKEDSKEKGINEKLAKLIQKEKPSKIFTHSGEDPHPDHRAVHYITQEVLKKIKTKPEVYIYSVWNPVSFKTNYPSLYINITKYFKLKLRALKTFKSQKVHVAYPLFMLIYRAFKDGLKIKGGWFGEHFFRIQ